MYKVIIESVDEITEYRTHFKTRKMARVFADAMIDKKMKEKPDCYVILIQEA